MKTQTYYSKLMKAGAVATAALTMAVSARADAYWGGAFDSNWANLGNWTGTGDPANAAGATIINGGNYACIVSTTGNTTSGDLYISYGHFNAQLSIATGGQLTVAANFITGQWGNSLPVNVTGQLTINGYLLTGNGGYDGDVNISSGGTVESGALSMNTGGGAKMDIATNGTYITHISQLGNVNYWVANNAITANGNAAGWAINLDTNSLANKLKLTAVYTPPQIGRAHV